eukprot:TRINITY_DN4137_c0_g1_i1.p1 TRINITY_DN4137_c0_g1~~TRINITY_DN4137_c0_g1_i1.p1  ORF type:complete len:347 (+),score=67.93 TRINITY_DN4137_c0_g1_i1:37-1077(+)
MGIVSFLCRIIFLLTILVISIPVVLIGYSYGAFLTSPLEPSFLSNEPVDIKTKGPLTWQRIKTNGVVLNTITCGEDTPDKTMVLMLHGFPESAFLSWHHQIGPICDAGYFVVVPDQRGYNTSSKPDGAANYIGSTLAKDAIGLIDHFKRRDAVVIGHDWGGVVAWRLTHDYPERVNRLCILNAPNAWGFRNLGIPELMNQILKSSYMVLFNVPGFSEYVLSRDDYAVMKSLFKIAGNGNQTFSKDYIRMNFETIQETNSLTTMLNWYRAIFRETKRPDLNKQITPMTLIIWGIKDTALSFPTALGSVQGCKNAKIEKIDAGHFVQAEQPAVVTNKILAFLNVPSIS